MVFKFTLIYLHTSFHVRHQTDVSIIMNKTPNERT